jgi:hypothetical protein
MKVKLSLLLLVVLAAAAPAGFAQTGVAGKWTGELSAADGHGVAQPITIELKLDGTNLSGTVTEGALEARPIQGATVDGNNVSFRTTRNLGAADINVNWKGELKGEDLALSREIGPAPAEAGGGRGGGGGGRGGAAAPAAGGGRGGGRGGAGAAPAAGAQAPAAAAPAAAAPIPPVPGAADGAAAAGGRGAGGRGGGGRGAAPAGAGAAAGGGGRGAAAAAGPTVQLTLRRAK